MADIVKNIKESLFGKKLSEEEKQALNAEFISKIAPVGGLDFSHAKYVQSGNGYEACVYVFSYPKNVSNHWLSLLTNIDGTIGVLDISTLNTAEVKLNLKKSLEEQNSRFVTAKSDAEKIDAQQQYREIEEMYREVSNFGEVMKTLVSRIYVPAATLYEADKKVKEIIKNLEGSGFRAAICLNETKSDFQNLLLPYGRQQEKIYKRKGQAVTSGTLAGGNPFHFSYLSDPNGAYYGKTTTGGSVLLDIFRREENGTRMSYDFVSIGKKGAGKSTTLKKILVDRAARGDIVRVFDVSGEYRMVVESLGGKIISLDGAGARINILQILPNDENQQVAFKNHIEKVCSIYELLKKGNVNEDEELVLKQVLLLLYRACNICNNDGSLLVDLTELKPEDFPILSDLLQLVRYIISKMESDGDEVFQLANIRGNKRSILEDIELKLVDLTTTHKNIFDGHTSIKDFYNEEVVCFSLKNLIHAEPGVFDAQLFNALMICWDNIVVVGKKMKDLVREGKIREEDIVHTLILIDEAHLTINANKPAAVSTIIRIVREGRKYFAGLGLASQSIRDFVPDNAETQAVEQMKTLFELTTYKFIMQQDSNAIPKIRDIFQNTFSDAELEAIPLLTKGECILSISGDRNLSFKVWASKDELYLFDGGL